MHQEDCNNVASNFPFPFLCGRYNKERCKKLVEMLRIQICCFCAIKLKSLKINIISFKSREISKIHITKTWSFYK